MDYLEEVIKEEKEELELLEECSSCGEIEGHLKECPAYKGDRE
jgi:uncharacterized Zn finger protein